MKALNGVERLERLIVGAGRRDRRKQPALRRLRIDVIEMLEVSGVFQVAEHRHAVHLGAAIVGGSGAQYAGAQRTVAETERVPTVE